jgi:hypothetical protein
LRDGVTGWLCDASPAGLARGLGQAIVEPATAARVGKNARADAIQRFSRSRFGADLRDVVDELLGVSRGPSLQGLEASRLGVARGGAGERAAQTAPVGALKPRVSMVVPKPDQPDDAFGSNASGLSQTQATRTK